MISLAIAVGLSVLLYGVTFIVHYEALQIISGAVDRSGLVPHARMLLVLFGIAVAHLIEISLYAFVFWFANHVLLIGGFTGARMAEPAAYFYFSAETFTSLGMGDIYPNGALRLITSLEVLNGLLLIGWSTSFTFVAMSRLWELRGNGPRSERA
jgi:hypothetical protein